VLSGGLLPLSSLSASGLVGPNPHALLGASGLTPAEEARLVGEAEGLNR